MRCLPLAVLVACAPVEPLDLPDDPSVNGVPVGVTTLVQGDLDIEIWYPATDATGDEPTEDVDFATFASPEVAAAIGDFDLPVIPTIAVRDADLRRTEEPLSVVLFSHGFGGTRLQSVDLTTHLASRGYVVLATDHAGRSLQDLLPCLFSPPLEGCNLALGGDDPAEDDIDVLADLVTDLDGEERGRFEGRLRVEGLGPAGHSAGAGTTARVGSSDDRFDALLPMAAGTPVTRDVPTLRMGATCDQTVPWEGVVAGHAQGAGGLLGIEGAGHLAFSDLCTLDLGAFAETWLEGRDDVNDFFLESLVALATDGCPESPPAHPAEDCPEAFLPLETSTPIVRHYATVFFDDALGDRGAGVEAGVYEHTVLDPLSE